MAPQKVGAFCALYGPVIGLRAQMAFYSDTVQDFTELSVEAVLDFAHHRGDWNTCTQLFGHVSKYLVKMPF